MKNESKTDPAALFRLGYGLYAITVNDGKKDNAMIANTVMQITNAPDRVAVALSKSTYTHEVIQNTGRLNVNCLSENAPFDFFRRFGFQSGRNTDKFANEKTLHRSENGLVLFPEHATAFLSLTVERSFDADTHSIFLCTVDESKILSDAESMTYAYYHKNVKQTEVPSAAKGYVCTVCGWVYEGATLPEDIACPICNHGASAFEAIK